MGQYEDTRDRDAAADPGPHAMTGHPSLVHNRFIPRSAVPGALGRIAKRRRSDRDWPKSLGLKASRPWRRAGRAVAPWTWAAATTSPTASPQAYGRPWHGLDDPMTHVWRKTL